MTSERPRRTRKTRLVMRDGEQVLRANDYDLQEGEKSVWDRELAEAEPDEPLEETTTTKTKKAKKAAAPCGATKRKAAANGAAVGKKKNKVEASEMKALIAEEIAARRDRRAAFALRHAEAMRAFGAKLPTTPPSMAEPATVAAVAPRELTATLRPHQEEGLRWLVSMHDDGVSQILGDEMGLGKTIQTIALLTYLKFSRKLRGPSLVVCPLSVLSSWMVEFKKFSPSMRIVKLHSSDADERERIRRDVLRNPFGYDVVVTTYEMAKSMATVLGGTTWWRYLILDEGHWCKSETSEISRAVRRVHFGHCLLLTGTPLQNNLHELWALLNLLHSDWFPSSDKFDGAFELDGAAAKSDRAALDKAHRLLKPLMLRRLKQDVERGLPPKLETKILCPLTECQAFWYKRLLLKGSAQALDALEKAGADSKAPAATAAWKKLQSLMMQLRKCANHPYLFEGADPNPGVTDEALVEASGKLKMLDRLLDRLIKAGHRCVVFSQFTSQLDIIDDMLRWRDIRYCRLDGGTNRVQRTVDINAFNASGSRIKVFIMSTRAGGLGINLQTADTCILYDSDWNPQADLQVHTIYLAQIGQTKPVHVYRLVTEGTVEERIVQRAEHKLYLDKMVNRDGADAATAADTVGNDELLSALTFGADAIVESGGDEDRFDDASIDAIIDRTRSAEANVEGLISGGAAKQAVSYQPATTNQSIRMLKGVVLGDKKDAVKDTMTDIAVEWAKKRRHKQRLITTRVAGVGEVAVLASTIDDSDAADLVTKKADAMAVDADAEVNRKRQVEWEMAAAAAALDAVGDHQKAGRDYDHMDECMACWDGGDLIMCDFCPTSWHMGCLEKLNCKLPSSAKQIRWACPHHSCAVCARTSSAAGGLLFRCAVCPQSFCEDHLPASARIIGRSRRFQDLGQRHPGQACFVLCAAECAKWAIENGEIGDADDYGTASGIIGATGVDTTAATSTFKRAKAPSRKPTITDLDRLDAIPRAALSKLVHETQSATLASALPRLAAKLKDASSRGAATTLRDLLLTDAAAVDESVSMTDVQALAANWRGAACLVPADATKRELLAAAASLALRFERSLDTLKTYELEALSAFLDVAKLRLPFDSEDGSMLRAMVIVPGRPALSRKMMMQLISVFLAWPRQSALFFVSMPAKYLRYKDVEAAEKAVDTLKRGRKKNNALMRAAKALRAEFE
ncbi:hypothetical protein CTAYLR_009472, partial [Chrysophaeum taylorii]